MIDTTKAVVKLKPEKNSGLLFHIFIYSFAFLTFHGYITISQCDQLPDGSIAQLVEHCTGIAEVMGSNPVQISVRRYTWKEKCLLHSSQHVDI